MVGNNGDLRSDEARRVAVGEADDGHIAGYRQTPLLDALESTEGDDVVEGNDGVGWITHAHKLVDGLLGKIVADVATPHKIAVDGDIVLAQRLQITVLAAADHVEMIRTTDESNPAAASSYEVLGGTVGSNVTVGNNLGEELGQTRAGKKYERNAHIMDFLEVGVVGGVLGQTCDDALNMEVDEVVDGLLLTRVVLMRVGADDGVAERAGEVLYAVEDSGVIMSDKIRNHHTDNPRSFLAEALGERIRTIVKLLGQLLDALLHLLANLVAVAKGTAHRGDANAKALGKIL